MQPITNGAFKMIRTRNGLKCFFFVIEMRLQVKDLSNTKNEPAKNSRMTKKLIFQKDPKEKKWSST